MKLLLLLLTFLVSTQAYSLNEKGNGGDAIVCYSPAGVIESVQLLDYYEALQKGRISELSMGGDDLNYEQKVYLVLDRLAQINPSRANLYKKWFKTFFSEEEFTWASNILNINDTGVFSFPENCEVKQIAVQENPELPGDKRYTINKTLWNKMDQNNKAGLVLHELIYREAKDDKSFNDSQVYLRSSKRVRYYNSMISSQDSFTQKEYFKVLENARLSQADIDGIPFSFIDKIDRLGNVVGPVTGIQYDERSNVHSMYLEGNKNNYMVTHSFFKYQGFSVGLAIPEGRTELMTFHNNGTLKNKLVLLPIDGDIKLSKAVTVSLAERSESFSRLYKRAYFHFLISFNEDRSINEFTNYSQDKGSPYKLTTPIISNPYNYEMLMNRGVVYQRNYVNKKDDLLYPGLRVNFTDEIKRYFVTLKLNIPSLNRELEIIDGKFKLDKNDLIIEDARYSYNHHLSINTIDKLVVDFKTGRVLRIEDREVGPIQDISELIHFNEVNNDLFDYQRAFRVKSFKKEKESALFGCSGLFSRENKCLRKRAYKSCVQYKRKSIPFKYQSLFKCELNNRKTHVVLVVKSGQNLVN